MPMGNRRRMRGWTERRFYASALQLTLLFTTIASSFALIANWSGSPDLLVEWLCGVSAVLLLVVTAVKAKL